MSVGKRLGLALSLCCLIAAAPVMAGGPPPSCDLTTPTIQCLSSTPSSITLQVCGTGACGAPAGFSIHMKKRADYLVDGWAATGSYTCLSLGGNCNQGNNPWSLSSGECTSVVISATTVADYAGQNICGVSSDCGIDPLVCGTEYVFRVFAHADGAGGGSDKGPVPPLVCSTAACPPTGECTLTWGYWKTHGPEGCSPGNQANDWNLNSIPVGGLSLSQADACAIMHDNPNACGKGGGSNSGANAVLILEHQLIAAELNVAEGAIKCAFADQAIVAANAILAGKEYDCVGASTALGQQMIAIKNLLAAYNEDQCTCPAGASTPESSANTPSNSRKASWGGLKSIYR